MRGRGITSGRRRHRPDGSYYRQTRRRSVTSGGWHRPRGRRSWAGLAVAMVALIAVAVWMLQ